MGNVGKDSLSGLLAIMLGYYKNDSKLEGRGQESETFVLSMADYLVDIRNRKRSVVSTRSSHLLGTS